jgi:RecA-family ATPase
MASQLDTVILFADACETFTTEILPMIQESEQRLGHIDMIARCEAWNDWIDGLNQDDQISDWQVENWSHITDVSPALQRR